MSCGKEYSLRVRFAMLRYGIKDGSAVAPCRDKGHVHGVRPAHQHMSRDKAGLSEVNLQSVWLSRCGTSSHPGHLTGITSSWHHVTQFPKPSAIFFFRECKPLNNMEEDPIYFKFGIRGGDDVIYVEGGMAEWSGF